VLAVAAPEQRDGRHGKARQGGPQRWSWVSRVHHRSLPGGRAGSIGGRPSS